MTPQQYHEAAALAMRETAALMLEEEVETYNEGLSAIDTRLSFTRNLKWPNGRKAAAAIRALSLPAAPTEPTAEGQEARSLHNTYRYVAEMGELLKATEAERDTTRADVARMKAAMEKCEKALQLVDQWKHGLRHRTAHESLMVDAAEQALAALKGT